MTATATTALDERERLLAEQQHIVTHAQQARERARELEAKVPRLEREWHAALAHKARRRKNAAQQAERVGADLATARGDLDVAKAEAEAAALAVQQIANEIEQLFFTDIPAFVAEAEKTSRDIELAAHTAAVALQAVQVAWAAGAEAWRPLRSSLQAHVASIDQQSGRIRGSERLIRDSQPRPLPSVLGDALGVLRTVASGDVTPRPVGLNAARRPDPDDVISMDLRPDFAKARAELGDA